MKKLLSLSVVVVIMLSFFAGCGQSQPAKTSEPAQSSAASAAPASTPAQSSAPDQGWVPQKEVSFLVPSAAGGGSDFNARAISEYVSKYKLSPKSFMVEIKAGGSGQVAYAEAVKRKGDPHTLVVLHSGQVMSAAVSKSPVQGSDMTYIATVALDELTLATKKGAKYQNIEEFLEAGKKEGIKVGGSNRLSGDHLALEMLNKYAGTKFTYIHFNSSGEVMSAVLGGHVDAGIFNPNEAKSQIEGGEAVPLAVFAEKRIPGVFKDTPTFIELGYKDIKLAEVRAISGPPDMPPEAIKYYEETMKKVTELPEWQTDYIDKGYMTNYYLNAADTKKYMDEYVKNCLEIFKDIEE